MGTNRLSSIRYGWFSVWLLVATAAALDLYDEAPTGLPDTGGQEQNSIEESWQDQLPPLTAKDLFIYKLIMSLRNMRSEPDLDSNERSISHHITDRFPSYQMEKDKRMINLLKETTTRRPQQQKIRKEKTVRRFIPVVCYFKLCTFGRYE